LNSVNASLRSLILLYMTTYGPHYNWLLYFADMADDAGSGPQHCSPTLKWPNQAWRRWPSCWPAAHGEPPCPAPPTPRSCLTSLWLRRHQVHGAVALVGQLEAPLWIPTLPRQRNTVADRTQDRTWTSNASLKTVLVQTLCSRTGLDIVSEFMRFLGASTLVCLRWVLTIDAHVLCRFLL
jgi:hypothetical protein